MARSIDADTFGSMYERHADVLFGYLARRVGRDLAEDLLAELFHTAIESYGSFDTTRGTERAWLFGIASNLLRHHWRSEQRRLRALARHSAARQTNIDPLLTVEDHVADRMAASADAERVIDAITEISPDDRTLLFLSGWEHLNSSEIGMAMDIPAATVRSRLRRLRQHLRHVTDTPPPPRKAER